MNLFTKQKQMHRYKNELIVTKGETFWRDKSGIWDNTHISKQHSGQIIHLPMQEMQEMRVQSLACEDPLKKEMATCSSILAWKISWTEGSGGLYSP